MNVDLCKRVIADTIAEHMGATIDELVDAAFEADVFGDQWRDHAARRLGKVEIRRLVKSMKAAGGMPLYFNVGQNAGVEVDEIIEEDAGVYKPIPLFGPSDFAPAARPYHRMVDRGVAVLQHLQVEAAKYGVQLPLPAWFPSRTRLTT